LGPWGCLVTGFFLGWIFGYDEKRHENFIDKFIAVFLAAVTIWLLVGVVVNGFMLIYT